MFGVAKAADYAAKSPSQMARLVRERGVQSLLMANVHCLIRCVLSYGGHIMLENPTHSKLWNEPCLKSIESSVSSKHTCRSFVLNRCIPGSRRFKQYTFLTSLPEKFTAHMESAGDPRFKHPPCNGRDTNGVAAARATGVITLEAMLVSTIGLVVGSEKVISDVSDSVHMAEAHVDEVHRIECDVPFEEANAESYLAGVCKPCVSHEHWGVGTTASHSLHSKRQRACCYKSSPHPADLGGRGMYTSLDGRYGSTA